MLGFYETAVLLHEYCAYQRVRLFTAYLYMLEFVACANRCWKHSLVHAVIHRVYLTLGLALHYETLIDDWAWHYRSKILLHYSYKIHQIWISYTAVRWQQFKAQHTVPPRACEYCSLMNREIRLIILHRKLPFAEVKSRLVHVSLDDLDIPSYGAISYQCRDSEEKSRIIVVDGRSLKVTNIAYEILLDRSLIGRARVLWIDSVCVDEDIDHLEKREQALLARDVYSRASQVVVWLGHC